MITVGQACMLGAVQGLTEFLPVSSDGHLALLHSLIAPLPARETLAIDVALHAGTLAATLWYFRRDLLGMIGALVTREQHDWRWRWIGLLALGSVPVAIVGYSLRTAIEHTFTSMTVVGVNFIITGTLLFFTRLARTARTEADVSAGDALAIGCLQATALLPGISRSATTISGGLLRGLRPDVAARFSFLLGIPAVFGAQLLEMHAIGSLDAASRTAVLTGTAVAGVTGVAAIWALMRVMRSGRLYYFAYYLWPLGTLVLMSNWGRGG
jgi:undecaprenyl-diphosphatase